MMNLFENLQKLHEKYVWLNSDNHTVQWNDTLPNGIYNYAQINGDILNKYNLNLTNKVDLTDLEDYDTFINDIFVNVDVRNIIKKRYDDYVNKMIASSKSTNKPKCDACGYELTDFGECPKCLNFPNYEDNI